MTKSKIGILTALAGFLTYLILGSGLHGDDLSTIAQFSNWTFFEWITPNPVRQEIFLLSYPSYILFFGAYWLFGSNFEYLYDFIKIIMHLFFLWCSFNFFKDYLSKDRALIAALIFILNPVHDATTYWYMCLPYLFSTSLILLAHKIVRLNFLKTGFLICLLGAFSFYSSPPYVVGLSILFLFDRSFKKFFMFLIPGLIYCTFYIVIGSFTEGVERRVNSSLEVMDVMQNFLLQPITMFDSLFGPSFILKIISSIQSISVSGVMISLLAALYIANLFKKLSAPATMNKQLLLSVCLILVLSFAMYAFTGLYNHSPFNLGNRSTLYGSLLFAIMLATYIPSKKIGALILVSLFILPSVGLSQHWKEWNQTQKVILNQIEKNISLSSVEADSMIFIKNNLYSKLGSYSHIEFLIMPWTLKALSPNQSKMVALTNYLEIKDENTLIDKKWGHEINLSKIIYIYDSDTAIILRVSHDELLSKLNQQPKIIRHWIQFLEGTKMHNFLVSMYPRIEYIF